MYSSDMYVIFRFFFLNLKVGFNRTLHREVLCVDILHQASMLTGSDAREVRDIPGAEAPLS